MNNTFLACQYFTVRGVRTLNGKLVQHKLSNYYQKHPHPEAAPIPAKVSYYHFMDESFHFNSSTIISHDVITCLGRRFKNIDEAFMDAHFELFTTFLIDVWTLYNRKRAASSW